MQHRVKKGFRLSGVKVCCVFCKIARFSMYVLVKEPHLNTEVEELVSRGSVAKVGIIILYICMSACIRKGVIHNTLDSV